MSKKLEKGKLNPSKILKVIHNKNGSQDVAQSFVDKNGMSFCFTHNVSFEGTASSLRGRQQLVPTGKGIALKETQDPAKAAAKEAPTAP